MVLNYVREWLDLGHRVNLVTMHTSRDIRPVDGARLVHTSIIRSAMYAVLTKSIGHRPALEMLRAQSLEDRLPAADVNVATHFITAYPTSWKRFQPCPVYLM